MLLSACACEERQDDEPATVPVRKVLPEVEIVEKCVEDVPPTVDNINKYAQIVEYWTYGIKPYDGFRPCCSLRQAQMTLEGMERWTACVASAYDVESNFGTVTASGIPLNDHDVTVAHKTLPLGSTVRIWWAGNTIDALVTDRGPYIDGRDFDLAAGACMALSGMTPMDWGVRDIWYKIVRYPDGE